MLRREWRQQVLVLSLLSVAVAAAIGFATAAYNAAPVPGNAEFGTANHWLTFQGDDPDALQADVAAAEEWFGTIDVIGHRAVSVPGRFEPVDHRAQDPEGAYSSPMLAPRSGRYPTAAGEAAVTDAVAEDFGLDVGASVALDGTTRTVVGVVENPSDLSDEFVLLAPGSDAAQDTVAVLVDASSERVDGFERPSGRGREVSSCGCANEGVFAAVGVLGVATVALVLVALLAAAGFVVVLAVGVVAAVVGAALALVGWIAVEPRLETAWGYRIGRFNVPWWLIASGMVLALLTATGAAWWPARAVSRTSIVGALSGRPARPRPVHRSAALAGALRATPPHRRPARRRPRHCGRHRPHHRNPRPPGRPGQPALGRHRRGRAPGARRPRHDHRTDPQRDCRRRAHPHRHRSHQHHPSRPHRGHCRRVGRTRRRARHRRRACHPGHWLPR
jgi:putative ABC transport system permease protein